MNDLTGFQRDILYIIGGNDAPKGTAINDMLSEYYEEDVNHGRLYPNLDDLVSMGLLEKGAKDDRTNEYELTDRGVRELEARRAWENERIEL